MADDSLEFWIHPTARAAVAVYAVAIGDRLGLSETELRSLRQGAENSTLTGEESLDCVLLFLQGLYRQNGLGQVPIPEPLLKAAAAGDTMTKAYCEVARLIQPLPVSKADGQ